jgi:hypothetical protein
LAIRVNFLAIYDMTMTAKGALTPQMEEARRWLRSGTAPVQYKDQFSPRFSSVDEKTMHFVSSALRGEVENQSSAITPDFISRFPGIMGSLNRRKRKPSLTSLPKSVFLPPPIASPRMAKARYEDETSFGLPIRRQSQKELCLTEPTAPPVMKKPAVSSPRAKWPIDKSKKHQMAYPTNEREFNTSPANLLKPALKCKESMKGSARLSPPRVPDPPEKQGTGEDDSYFALESDETGDCSQPNNIDSMEKAGTEDIFAIEASDEGDCSAPSIEDKPNEDLDVMFAVEETGAGDQCARGNVEDAMTEANKSIDAFNEPPLDSEGVRSLPFTAVPSWEDQKEEPSEDQREGPELLSRSARGTTGRGRRRLSSTVRRLSIVQTNNQMGLFVDNQQFVPRSPISKTSNQSVDRPAISSALQVGEDTIADRKRRMGLREAEAKEHQDKKMKEDLQVYYQNIEEATARISAKLRKLEKNATGNTENIGSTTQMEEKWQKEVAGELVGVEFATEAQRMHRNETYSEVTRLMSNIKVHDRIDHMQAVRTWHETRIRQHYNEGQTLDNAETNIIDSEMNSETPPEAVEAILDQRVENANVKMDRFLQILKAKKEAFATAAEEKKEAQLQDKRYTEEIKNKEMSSLKSIMDNLRMELKELNRELKEMAALHGTKLREKLDVLENAHSKKTENLLEMVKQNQNKIAELNTTIEKMEALLLSYREKNSLKSMKVEALTEVNILPDDLDVGTHATSDITIHNKLNKIGHSATITSLPVAVTEFEGDDLTSECEKLKVGIVNVQMAIEREEKQYMKELQDAQSQLQKIKEERISLQNGCTGQRNTLQTSKPGLERQKKKLADLDSELAEIGVSSEVKALEAEQENLKSKLQQSELNLEKFKANISTPKEAREIPGSSLESQEPKRERRPSIIEAESFSDHVSATMINLAQSTPREIRRSCFKSMQSLLAAVDMNVPGAGTISEDALETLKTLETSVSDSTKSAGSQDWLESLASLPEKMLTIVENASVAGFVTATLTMGAPLSPEATESIGRSVKSGIGLKKGMLRDMANSVEEAVLIAVGPRQNQCSVGSFSAMNESRLALNGTKLLHVGSILSRIILTIKGALHKLQGGDISDSDMLNKALHLVTAKDKSATVSLSEILFSLSKSIGHLVIDGHGINKDAAEACQNLALLYLLHGAQSHDVPTIKLTKCLVENILHRAPPTQAQVNRVYLALCMVLLQNSNNGKHLQDSSKHADVLRAIEEPGDRVISDPSLVAFIEALSKFMARQYYNLKRYEE